MSAREILQSELARQPDSVVEKLLDYLHELNQPAGAAPGDSGTAVGHFAGYWSRYYGALAGEEWSRPAELPCETRAEW